LISHAQEVILSPAWKFPDILNQISPCKVFQNNYISKHFNQVLTTLTRNYLLTLINWQEINRLATIPAAPAKAGGGMAIPEPVLGIASFNPTAPIRATVDFSQWLPAGAMLTC
jgi:hypothetical protein